MKVSLFIRPTEVQQKVCKIGIVSSSQLCAKVLWREQGWLFFIFTSKQKLQYHILISGERERNANDHDSRRWVSLWDLSHFLFVRRVSPAERRFFALCGVLHCNVSAGQLVFCRSAGRNEAPAASSAAHLASVSRRSTNMQHGDTEQVLLSAALLTHTTF